MSNVVRNGFTLIELLVVISIMGLLLGVFTVNLAGQRVARSLNIAQNELVTNLRGLQSYSLSSRNINGSQRVQYYVAKFDMGRPDQYTLQAMYNVNSAPVLQDVQIIKFPSGVTFSAASSACNGPICINGNAITHGCALLAFRLPFAKVIMSDGCNQNNWNPLTDDYQKILNFVVNSSGLTTTSTDRPMIITLGYNQTAAIKTVTIRGMTGAIFFQ